MLSWLCWEAAKVLAMLTNNHGAASFQNGETRSRGESVNTLLVVVVAQEAYKPQRGNVRIVEEFETEDGEFMHPTTQAHSR